MKRFLSFIHKALFLLAVATISVAFEGCSEVADKTKDGATVGAMPEGGLNIAEPGDVATVGSGVVIGKGAVVGPKAMVSSDVKDGEEQW